MKWLQDNPLGMALAAVSGVFVLLALGMAILWNLPVSVNMTGTESEGLVSSDPVLVPREIGVLNEYRIINEKPVFNESRTPVLVAGDEDLAVEDETIEVKDAPDVKLTGVVITPGVKIASLTPANGKLENVMAHEGQPLSGEFVGWQVSSITPRLVTLESRNGQRLELELQVHDATIQEPPKPVQPQEAIKQASGGDEQMTGEDDEPLTRAEQIRQRIAQRREELRLEQEEQRADNEAQAGAARKPAPTKSYQDAIKGLMNNKPKDQGKNDNEES